ncbi:MAG: hypothetical protein K2X27_25705, partial [Candidatus Obscuribacterales bacterium]|nr:hypothetical protein [Candidatus Obscuribacterales bacterium]
DGQMPKGAEGAWLQNFVDWWKDMGRWNENTTRIASLVGTDLVPPSFLSEQRNRWSSRNEDLQRLMSEIDSIKNAGSSATMSKFDGIATIVGAPISDLSMMRVLTNDERYLYVNTLNPADKYLPPYALGSKVSISGNEILKGWVEANQSDVKVNNSSEAPDSSKSLASKSPEASKIRTTKTAAYTARFTEASKNKMMSEGLMRLQSGEVCIESSVAMTILAGTRRIKIAPNSIALIDLQPDKLSVRSLYDKQGGAIQVSSGKNNLPLRSGEEVVLRGKTNLLAAERIAPGSLSRDPIIASLREAGTLEKQGMSRAMKYVLATKAAPITKGYQTIPIQNAVSQGKISFNLKGDGKTTESCRLYMVNDCQQALHVVIPKGQFFVPAGDTTVSTKSTQEAKISSAEDLDEEEFISAEGMESGDAINASITKIGSADRNSGSSQSNGGGGKYDIMMNTEDRSIDIAPGASRWMEIGSLSASPKEFLAPPNKDICYVPDFHPDQNKGKLIPVIWDLSRDLDLSKAFDKIVDDDRAKVIAQSAIWNEIAGNPSATIIGNGLQDAGRILAAADLVNRLSRQIVYRGQSGDTENTRDNISSSDLEIPKIAMLRRLRSSRFPKEVQ